MFRVYTLSLSGWLQWPQCYKDLQSGSWVQLTSAAAFRGFCYLESIVANVALILFECSLWALLIGLWCKFHLNSSTLIDLCDVIRNWSYCWSAHFTGIPLRSSIDSCWHKWKAFAVVMMLFTLTVHWLCYMLGRYNSYLYTINSLLTSTASIAATFQQTMSYTEYRLIILLENSKISFVSGVLHKVALH